MATLLNEKASADARSFLVGEYSANRAHIDHINDHRVKFLQFYVGYVGGVIAACQVILGSNGLARQTAFAESLLGMAICFGLLTLLIMSNYWLSRDFHRLRNQLILEELDRAEIIISRYTQLTKKPVKRKLQLNSMFFYVSLMIIVANEILAALLLSFQDDPDFRVVLVGFGVFQVILVTCYRVVELGIPKPIPTTLRT